MIEINHCVPPGQSRGNQSWFNCVMTSISVGENSSGSSHLIAQHREPVVGCHSGRIGETNIFVNAFLPHVMLFYIIKKTPRAKKIIQVVVGLFKL